jgi:hypothetical protein
MNRSERRRSTVSNITQQGIPYLFVATPMYGGMCYGAYTGSIARAVSVFYKERINYIYMHTTNSSLVTQARDELAAQFLSTQCSHLLFIDSDIEFMAEDIVSMIDADKDIILGIYPKKTIELTPVCKPISGNNLPSGNSPVEVAAGGMGFALIKRKVLLGVEGNVPKYMSIDGRLISHFFSSGVSEGNLISEDVSFCELSRRCGYKVWAAPWISLAHHGSYRYIKS